MGGGLDDLAGYIERDSTYGSLSRYIHGFRGRRVIEELSDRNGIRLNSKVVKYGIPRKLKSGDVITVSEKVSFSVELIKPQTK